MSEITQKARIKLRIDTLANWKSNDPILYYGEVGFVKETGAYKVGTNSSGAKWSTLSFQSAVVKKNGDPTSSDSDYDVGTLWFNSKAGTLFCLDKNSNWSKMALDEDLQEVIEKLNDYMLTEEYAGTAATKSVQMADSLLAGDEYLEVNDANTAGLWTADKTNETIETAKEDAITEAYNKVIADKGQKNGIASLDKNGKVPTSQLELPSYVDDVVVVASESELASLKTAGTAEAGKIYIVSAAINGVADTQWRYASGKWIQITNGNITVSDNTSNAYGAAEGDINRGAIQCLIESIKDSATIDTFTNSWQDALDGNGCITAQLDELRTSIANLPNAFKSCAKKSKTENNTDLIVTDNIQDSAVTMNKLASDVKLAISGGATTVLEDDSVTTSIIVDDAVTTDKIADDAVTADKLADNAVTTDKLADSSVTADKVADKSLPFGKLTGDDTVTLILDCNA